MTIRPICITGEPVLHAKALPVTEWGDTLQALVIDMIDTMRAAPGVGLAAPQIGVPLQVFVWEWEDEKDVLHEGVVVNPSLELLDKPTNRKALEDDVEGCLSVPDERFPLIRSHSVRLQGLTLDQRPLEVVAEGWLARIFQHEYDHLQGTLYVDRLPFRTKRQARKAIKEQGWGKPGHSWLPGVDDYEGSGEDSEEP